MRIVTYNLEKDENDMPMLVKESSQNCPSISNSITDPGEAVAVLNQALQLDRKMEEHFCLIAMRSKKVIGIFKVNVGTISNSLVNTAGIFTRLLLCGATHFIIAHNHPSGNVSPSPEDEKVTENIQKISEMMGIVFCDHIIIGSGYFSFLEQNMLLFYRILSGRSDSGFFCPEKSVVKKFKHTISISKKWKERFL